MRWHHMLDWLPWHRRPLPVPELDAALAANMAAHKDIAAEEASLNSQLAHQHSKAEAMLDGIRKRAAKGFQPNPTLVTIAATLKSMEKPS